MCIPRQGYNKNEKYPLALPMKEKNSKNKTTKIT